MTRLNVPTLVVLVFVLAALGVASAAQNTISYGGKTYDLDSGVSAPAPAAQPAPPEKLQQIVAPIALYPDALLSQVLIASTFPTQVVEAYEWQQKNPNLTGDAAGNAVKDMGWDPSVQSMVQFPQVLDRMFQNLEWTQDLGEAFVAQKSEVMGAIQTMRQNAYNAGNLKSSSQQTVTQENATIVIEPADPQVIYVPAYDPASIYGGWAPAYWYYPPAVYAPWFGWYPGRGALAFGVGVAVGAAWSGAWGCDWAHGNIYVHNNYYHGYYGASGSYHGANGSVGHYGNTTAAYNRNTGEVHSYNAATGVERSGQAYQGAYGGGVKGENGGVAHAGDTTASYNRNTGEVHSYNSATGNARSGDVDDWDRGSADRDARGYGGGGFSGGGEAAASDRGWESRGGGMGSGGGFDRGGGFGGGGGGFGGGRGGRRR